MFCQAWSIPLLCRKKRIKCYLIQAGSLKHELLSAMLIRKLPNSKITNHLLRESIGCASFSLRWIVSTAPKRATESEKEWGDKMIEMNYQPLRTNVQYSFSLKVIIQMIVYRTMASIWCLAINIAHSVFLV